MLPAPKVATPKVATPKVANSWVLFVKTYHVENGIPYGKALRSSECQEAYKRAKYPDRVLASVEARPGGSVGPPGGSVGPPDGSADDHIGVNANEPSWFVAVVDVVDKITRNFTDDKVFESVRNGGDLRLWNEYWVSMPHMNPMGDYYCDSTPASRGRAFAKHVFIGIQFDRQFRLSEYWELVMERQCGTESFDESQLSVLWRIFKKLP